MTSAKIVIDIPRIIQTGGGLFEEVSDLNGIALPAMYFDEIQGHKRDGEQVLKSMIQMSVQEMRENKHIYLKNCVKEIPDTCETPSDYLYLANVYVAIQERLYSKLKQIDNFSITFYMGTLETYLSLGFPMIPYLLEDVTRESHLYCLSLLHIYMLYIDIMFRGCLFVLLGGSGVWGVFWRCLGMCWGILDVF